MLLIFSFVYYSRHWPVNEYSLASPTLNSPEILLNRKPNSLSTNAFQKYTDQEIISLIKCQNEAAFCDLYDIYSAALYGIIIRAIPDEEKAAIALERTFSRIWMEIDQYHQSKSRIFTWMRNIAFSETLATETKQASGNRNQVNETSLVQKDSYNDTHRQCP